MNDRSLDPNESVAVLPDGTYADRRLEPAAESIDRPERAVAASDEATAQNETHSPTLLLTKLLQMADRYRAENSLRQAMSIYFELAEDHAGAPEAYDALERLLEIAMQYENGGEMHQARSLYERLL